MSETPEAMAFRQANQPLNVQAKRQQVLDAQYKLKEEIIDAFRNSAGAMPTTQDGLVWWMNQVVNNMAIKLAKYQMTYGEIE